MAPKLYSLIMYDIIRKNSNPSCHLSLSELKQKFHESCPDVADDSNRKNVSRTLQTLLEYDSRIKISVTDGKITEVWYEQNFSYDDISNLALLIMDATTLSYDDKKCLMSKIPSLCGMTSPSDFLYDKLMTIEEAIQKKHCLSFHIDSDDSSERTVWGFIPKEITHEGKRHILSGASSVQIKLSRTLGMPKVPLIQYDVELLNGICFDDKNEFISF